MKYITMIALTVITMIGAINAQAEDRIYTKVFSNKAINGYDTVAFFIEGKPVKGESKFTTSYNGAEWYFSSLANLNKFKSNPEKYAPQYGGYCAWAVAQGNLAPGDPQYWDITDGKLYLNYNQAIQSQWVANKKDFIRDADKKISKLIQ